MATCDLDDLKIQACANDFFCLDKTTQRAVFLQLLCNLSESGGGGGGGATVGSGSPEGVVTDDPGAFYWDSTNQALYIKNSGTGNTDWRQLI
jgi:hypothetical protein